MTRTTRLAATGLTLWLAATSSTLFAQPQAPPAPPAPAAEADAPEPPVGPPAPTQWDRVQNERASLRRTAVRIGGSYTLGSNEVIGDVVVVGGDAVIEGRARDVVVVLGGARLGPGAVIDGSFTVIGGPSTIAPGARVRQDITVVGGTLDAPPDMLAGGDQVILDRYAFGGWFDRALTWTTRGLLWGRVLVPGLPWVWGVVAFTVFLSLVLLLVLPRPVLAATNVASAKPLTALLVGLLVMVLVGPLCVLLAASVIGVPVIPFVLCALIFAGLVGKIAVVRSFGRLLIPEEADESRAAAVRSFVAGFALIVVAYMIPVLGLVTWTMLGLFGVGAASLAFVAAYRRENPVAPRPVPPPAPPPPAGPSTEPPLADGFAAASEPVEIPYAAVPPRTAIASDLVTFPRATFWIRIAGGVLDVILVAIFARLVDDFDRPNLMFLLLIAYMVGFWAWKGTTVGGIICQLRVVRVDGAPLRFADALVRGLSTIFSGLVLGLGFLWMLKDPDRQAWQDKIAGTFVVKVPRHYPI